MRWYTVLRMGPADAKDRLPTLARVPGTQHTATLNSSSVRYYGDRLVNQCMWYASCTSASAKATFNKFTISSYFITKPIQRSKVLSTWKQLVHFYGSSSQMCCTLYDKYVLNKFYQIYEIQLTVDNVISIFWLLTWQFIVIYSQNQKR